MMNGQNWGDLHVFKVHPVQPLTQYSDWHAQYQQESVHGEGFDQILQKEMEKLKMEDTLEYVGKCLMIWQMNEMRHVHPHDEDIANEFITQVLRKRLQATEVVVGIPDELCLIIAMCTDGNPGQSLLILSDILQGIKDAIGPIPVGYIIKPEDFVRVFADKFPIMSDEEVYKKYEKKWDAQKIARTKPWETDNQVDTREYWRKFVE